MSTEDASLVREASRGSKQAFKHIYQKYRKRMLITAKAILHSKEDSEDCVHNVFKRILEPSGLANLALDPYPDLGAYFIKAVKNEALQLKRSRTTTDKTGKKPDKTAEETDETDKNPSRLPRNISQPVNYLEDSQETTEEWLSHLSHAIGIQYPGFHSDPEDPEKTYEEEQKKLKVRQCLENLSMDSKKTLRAFLYCIIETDTVPSLRKLGQKLGVSHHTAGNWLASASKEFLTKFQQ